MGDDALAVDFTLARLLRMVVEGFDEIVGVDLWALSALGSLTAINRFPRARTTFLLGMYLHVLRET